MNLLLSSLVPYLRIYRWPLIWGCLFLILSNVFSIYPAQVVRDAFNLVGDLIRMQNLLRGFEASTTLAPLIGSVLLLFGGIVVVAALLRGYFLYLVRQTIIVVSRHIEYDQKNQLFDRYQQYSLSILRRRQTGDLMARITEDVGAVRMFTGPGIMYTLNTITLFIMVMMTMLFVNPLLTLYVLTPMPVLALSIYVVHSIINKRSEETQAQLSVLSSYTQEAYSGIRLLRAYAREEASMDNFTVQSNIYKAKAMRLAKVEALFYPLILLLIGLSTVFTVWIGGEKVMNGTLTLGNIAEFILYITQLTWPVASLGWITSMIQRAAASQKRLNEMLALRSELNFPEESAVPTDASLSFEHVSFTYTDSGTHALRDVSFELPSGNVLGIVGPTGCGKSTIANLLPRLMDPTDGVILLGGQPLQHYSMPALRSTVGYVPQDVFLFSDTIANNIAFGNKNATEQEIVSAAQFAGVYEDIMGFADGFATVIGERGVTLSGGQKQRVSIARAYLSRPSLLILDDALSAVDTRTEAHILANLQGNLREANYQPSLVIISHRISAVEHADLILVMEEGRIVERGTHTELLARHGYYALLNQRQLLEEEIVAR